ncbi:MAG TPA: pilin [Candidatus Nanoarchaeia archaeon]|nr:pilin [Candidatus Nanoarchaeia archaeon]
MKKVFFYLALPIFLFNFSAMLIFPLLPAQAQNDNPTDINNQQGFQGGEIPQAFGQTGIPADPRTIVANIIAAALGLLATIFIVLLIYAGFKYMTSLGNEEQTGSAKSQIVSAVIGLAIILAAWAITGFVFSCALGATGVYFYTAGICGPH